MKTVTAPTQMEAIPVPAIRDISEMDSSARVYLYDYNMLLQYTVYFMNNTIFLYEATCVFYLMLLCFV